MTCSSLNVGWRWTHDLHDPTDDLNSSQSIAVQFFAFLHGRINGSSIKGMHRMMNSDELTELPYRSGVLTTRSWRRCPGIIALTASVSASPATSGILNCKKGQQVCMTSRMRCWVNGFSRELRAYLFFLSLTPAITRTLHSTFKPAETGLSYPKIINVL